MTLTAGPRSLPSMKLSVLVYLEVRSEGGVFENDVCGRDAADVEDAVLDDDVHGLDHVLVEQLFLDQKPGLVLEFGGRR